MQVTLQDDVLKDVSEKARTIAELARIAEKGGDELSYASSQIRTISGKITAELSQLLEKAEEEEREHVYLQY